MTILHTAPIKVPKVTKFKKLSLEDRIKIYEFLKPIVKDVEGTEYVEYVTGWNDTNVAKHFSVGQSSVWSVRAEMFGHLKPSSSAPKTEENLASRVAGLEARIAFLEKELGVTLK